MTTADERVRESLVASTSSKDRAWFDAKLAKAKVHVQVQVGEGTDRRDHLVQASIIVNLLHRILPTLSVSGAPLENLFPPKTQLARPIQTPNQVPPDSDLVILIGEATPASNADCLWVDNRGWTAYLSTLARCTEPREKSNPIGAYYAGVLGVSQVFNRLFVDAYDRAEILNGTLIHDLVTFSTTDYNYEPRLDLPLRLPRSLIVGLGSIGQALVDILARLDDLRGDIWLVDHEVTDEGNESRYVLAYPSNRGQAKVGIARDLLKNRFPLLRVVMNIPLRYQTRVSTQMLSEVPGHLVPFASQEVGIQTRTLPMLDYQSVRQIIGDDAFDLAISCVDSEQTRRDIQMGLHRLVLNAWTDTGGGKLGFAVGRHVFDEQNACLACIYQPDSLDSEPTEVQFAARVLGWPEERIKAWVEDPHKLFGPSEIDELARKRMLPPEQIQALTGKNLQEFLHDEGCGLARMPGRDREDVAQVPHVPALAACHLATQLVLELAQHHQRIENLGVMDALALPNVHGKGASREKEPGCLCNQPQFRDLYRRLWGPS